MNLRLLIGCLLVAGISCKKEKIIQTKTPEELLVQQEWILKGHGFDDNHNGVLDPGENIMEDCQDDNSYRFRADGTGTYSDNTKVCGGVNDHDFNWQLLAGSSELHIESERMLVFRLNEEELVVSPDWPWLNADYILHYRH